MVVFYFSFDAGGSFQLGPLPRLTGKKEDGGNSENEADDKNFFIFELLGDEKKCEQKRDKGGSTVAEGNGKVTEGNEELFEFLLGVEEYFYKEEEVN